MHSEAGGRSGGNRYYPIRTEARMKREELGLGKSYIRVMDARGPPRKVGMQNPTFAKRTCRNVSCSRRHMFRLSCRSRSTLRTSTCRYREPSRIRDMPQEPTIDRSGNPVASRAAGHVDRCQTGVSRSVPVHSRKVRRSPCSMASISAHLAPRVRAMRPIGALHPCPDARIRRKSYAVTYTSAPGSPKNTERMYAMAAHFRSLPSRAIHSAPAIGISRSQGME